MCLVFSKKELWSVSWSASSNSLESRLFSPLVQVQFGISPRRVHLSWTNLLIAAVLMQSAPEIVPFCPPLSS